MSDKELIKKLNNLNKIKADSEWKNQNRQILMAQITQGSGIIHADEAGITKSPLFGWLGRISQPALAVFLITIFVLSSGIISIRAAHDTKPGDSLYIAKILNERAQFAFTFDDEGKARLGLEFAGNRAKELDQILAEPGNGEKEEKVEKLVNNFKKEISAAKSRIEKISSKTLAKESPKEEAPDAMTNEAGETDSADEDSQVFSANTDKDENGIQIFDPESTEADTESEETVTADTEEATSSDPAAEIASSTEEGTDEAPETSSSDPQTLLLEAEELLGSKDYDATLSKLDEAGNMIGQVDAGAVKGDNATSSQVMEPAAEEGEVLGVEEEATTTTIKN